MRLIAPHVLRRLESNSAASNHAATGATASSSRASAMLPNARAQGVANLSSPLHAPTFDLCCSFRVRDLTDPSSCLVVRIDALDLHAPTGSAAVCVGFASFSLFRHRCSVYWLYYWYKGTDTDALFSFPPPPRLATAEQAARSLTHKRKRGARRWRR